MKTGVILTVGNSLMGDDGAGPLLAKMLADAPARGWRTVDGGSMPENEVQYIRSIAPHRVLIFDAAEMDLRPGELRLVEEDMIAERLFPTTHVLPLSFLIRILSDFVPVVQLLAIQPSLVAFSWPMSAEVQKAVERVHRQLMEGVSPDTFQKLTQAPQGSDVA